MKNMMIETPGAKIRENFGKSKRPREEGGEGGSECTTSDCLPKHMPAASAQQKEILYCTT